MKRLIVTVLMTLSVPMALAGPKAEKTAKTEKTEKPTVKAGPGTVAVKQANDTISSELKHKVAAGTPEEKAVAQKVTASVRGFLDIDQLGKRAMTDNWSKLTKAQQDQFQSLLRALIEDSYIRGLRSNLSYQVSYDGETTDTDGNIVVATTVKTERKGRPFSINIEYVLVKQGDKLRAWDVKTDGVGLVENYRTMFNKIIARDGFDGLIAKMKKKQAATGT